MADTTSIASRMEKLAKLKRMKAGLAGDTASDAPEAAMVTDAQETAAPADSSAYDGGASDDLGSTSFDEATASPSDDIAIAMPGAVGDDADSLNDYFTALGINTPDDAESEAEAEAADDAVLVAEAAEADDLAKTDALLDAADSGLDPETLGALDDLAVLAGVADMPEPELPDFTMAEIDPELLEREFSEDAPATPPRPDESTADDGTTVTEDGGRISVTFDESRTTLLNHVSRQMDCAVEDVVVTALDWYLDALFGEDEEAKAG